MRIEKKKRMRDEREDGEEEGEIREKGDVEEVPTRGVHQLRGAESL